VIFCHENLKRKNHGNEKLIVMPFYILNMVALTELQVKQMATKVKKQDHQHQRVGLKV
jgi:hypothetical protein